MISRKVLCAFALVCSLAVPATALDPHLGLVVDNLNIQGQVDFGNLSGIVKVTPFSTVHGYVASGFNFGSWDGPGIISTNSLNNPLATTMMGVLSGQDFNDLGMGAFYGETVQNSWTLIKYTYFGDSDFSGTIDGGDYSIIDFAYNALHDSDPGNDPPIIWLYGDYDYSGGIDGGDYALIDNAFLNQGAPLAGGAAGPSPVPEPSSLILLAVASLAGVWYLRKRS